MAEEAIKKLEEQLSCSICLDCYTDPKCPLKGFKHHDHDYDELDSAFKRCENDITSSLDPMGTQVATIKKALAQFDVRHGEISDQRAAIADNIPCHLQTTPGCPQC